MAIEFETIYFFDALCIKRSFHANIQIVVVAMTRGFLIYVFMCKKSQLEPTFLAQTPPQGFLNAAVWSMASALFPVPWVFKF